MLTSIYKNGSDAAELPRLVRVAGNLYVAAFSLMKLLPARFMLDRARQAGLIKPGSRVFESSSGTLGLGLAMECARNNYRLTIVSEYIDPRLKRRFDDLGARVDLVTEPA